MQYLYDNVGVVLCQVRSLGFDHVQNTGYDFSGRGYDEAYC